MSVSPVQPQPLHLTLNGQVMPARLGPGAVLLAAARGHAGAGHGVGVLGQRVPAVVGVRSSEGAV